MGQYDSKRENLIVRFEATESVVVFRDGANTVAAVSVAVFLGYRQAISHNDLTIIRICDFD